MSLASWGSGIYDWDVYPNEKFQFVSHVYHVGKAREFISAKPRPVYYSTLEGIKSMIDEPIQRSEPNENGVRTATGGINIMAVSVDFDHVPNVNISIPIIIAFPPIGKNDKRIPLPIDGWHRINKAYRLMGATHIASVALTEEESDAITTSLLP